MNNFTFLPVLNGIERWCRGVCGGGGGGASYNH